MRMRPNAEAHAAIVTYVASLVVVLGTYFHWLVKSWHGDPVNPVVTTVALFLTLAGAYVLFGPATVTRAFGLLSDLRTMAGTQDDDSDETDS